MKIKFELTIETELDSVKFELKWPESRALSGVSFMGSGGSDDPLDAVVTNVAAQIKTIVEDRSQSPNLRGKYANVPTSVDDFLARKWEEEPQRDQVKEVLTRMKNALDDKEPK